jgi:hypothetical protein
LTTLNIVRECVSTFPSAQIRVTGRCMEPYLYEGDYVRLMAPSVRRPSFGDVALVQVADGALRLHRLIWPLFGVSDTAWRSMADRGRGGDGPIELLAIVAEGPRALGGWRVAAASLIGRIVCRLREAVRR